MAAGKAKVQEQKAEIARLKALVAKSKAATSQLALIPRLRRVGGGGGRGSGGLAYPDWFLED